MQVTIKTLISENTFDLNESQIVYLIEKAKAFVADNGFKKAAEESKRDRRVDHVFGNTWKTPKAPTPKVEKADGYKGFLHLRCEKCGRERTFCARTNMTFLQCECGHRTWLTNLSEAVVSCVCGGRYVYKTNVRDRQFTMTCLGCKKPVRLCLDCDGKNYISIK